MNLIRWLTVTVGFLGLLAVLVAVATAGTGAIWIICSFVEPDMMPRAKLALMVLFTPVVLAGTGMLLIALSRRLAEWQGRREVDSSGHTSEWFVVMREVGLTIVGFLLVFTGLVDLTYVAANLLAASDEVRTLIEHEAPRHVLTRSLRIAAGVYVFAGGRIRRRLARGPRDVRSGPEGAAA
jgi:hypothetical protein